ncbi:MAG: hypothetical protein HZA90_18350 [Verrucomicrobia bacterium]|nr:hypothetical protein [Verrucomicrobiota bacterium]
MNENAFATSSEMPGTAVRPMSLVTRFKEWWNGPNQAAPPPKKGFRSDSLLKLAELLKAPPLDPFAHVRRLMAVERDVILPIKLLFLGALVSYFFFTPWFGDVAMPRAVAWRWVKSLLLVYLLLNAATGVLLLTLRRWPLRYVQRLVFGMSFLDGLFVAALTVVTGGFESIVYWLFLGILVRNAVSNPLIWPQIILNLSVVGCYLFASVLDVVVMRLDIKFDGEMARAMEITLPDNFGETLLLRTTILVLMAACCYGVQVIFERERRTAEEGRESAARQEQLRAAGRLAAEIAHKIKNPLGIINNAAFSLQRALEQQQPPSLEQTKIIREEVDRADRIITELMGYAQLAEGHVERLNVVEELNRAIQTVFPPAARYSVQIFTEFPGHLPPLLMQRNHFSEILVNILQNSREVLVGIGQVHVRAWCEEDTVFISIRDDGPGIPPEKIERIFEPYFSTKEKGTGLGLAIARHNAEMYQGKIRARSVRGEGAEFILELPTRTFMKKRQ